MKIRVGHSAESGRTLYYSGGSHILEIGKTGVGKARDLLIPAVLDLPKRASAAIVDPKGQIFAVCADALRRSGKRVVALDSFGMSQQFGVKAERLRHNPMDQVRDDSKRFGMISDGLAESIFYLRGNETQPHFPESAQDLGSGVMMALASHGRPEEKNLATVRDVICGDIFGFARAVVPRTQNRFIRQKLEMYAEETAANKELVSIRSSAKTMTKFLGNEIVSDFLSASEFDFKELRKHPTVVFLITPLSAAEVCGPLNRLLLSSMFTALLDESMLGSLPVLCIIDETAQLNRLAILERVAATGRGFGCQLWTTWTDVPQIERIYQKGYRSLFANTGCQIFLGASDLTTSQELSDLCGQYEVISQSRCTTIDRNTGEPQVSDSDNQEARPLLLPQEIRNLPGDEMLMFVDGVNGPIRAKRRPYYEVPEFRGKYQLDPYEQGKSHGK